jgi:hypothetical protein
MAIERTYFCESPDCHGGSLEGDKDPCHVSTGSEPPYLPGGFIETREVDDQGTVLHHFCSWDCCMKFAAAQPIAEIIEMGGASE